MSHIKSAQTFALPSASSFPRFSIPLTDQGKCATGTMKKLPRISTCDPPYQKKSVPVRIIQDTSECVVPGQESRQQREEATSLLDRGIDLTFGVGRQICNREKQECHVKGEEQGKESDGRAEGRQQEDESEDEPALSGD